MQPRLLKLSPNSFRANVTEMAQPQQLVGLDSSRSLPLIMTGTLSESRVSS